ncbi:MAG: DNA mismatch repair endonuclease MutL [Oscillospiraceae bacterium]
MPKINLLSKEIAELIAAGEVIDRPCSVIKELIENSIDSGATAITAEIKNGGTTYMRISDNGCGISEEDIRTAFLRHATSKVKEKCDLDKILTLGFRGEALASIAAVSRVEVLTKVKGEQFGTHYIIEGSEEKLIEQCGCPDGTMIIIRDIFFNVPARQKFLKKDVTEGNAVSSVIAKLALSHPDISFKFIRDNRQDIMTPGDNDSYSAVYAVLGRAFADSLIHVDYTYEGIRVSGYTVKPLSAGSNRKLQNFFVNRRFVKSVTCTVSLEEAYRNVIMTGKFPSCVINIDIPPETIDVNVHPTKIEVRFSDEKTVFDAVYFAVKNAVMSYDIMKNEKKEAPPEPIKKVDYSVKVTPVVPTYTKSDQLSLSSERKPLEVSSEKASEVKPVVTKHTEVHEKPFEEPKIESLKTDIPRDTEFKYISQKAFQKREEPAPEREAVKEEKKLPEYRVIGEFLKTYILVECENELIVIDKHAAHERILFEKLKAADNGFSSQLLATPESVLLTPEQRAVVEENREIVENTGFTFSFSENNEVLITGIPTVFDIDDTAEIFCEIADNLSENRNNPQSARLDEIYHSMACKAAIKAHDKNDIRELEHLVKQVLSDDRIRYCPHGRPVISVITEKELEKKFKRVL